MKGALCTAGFLLLVATPVLAQQASPSPEKPAGPGIIAEQLKDGSLSAGDKYDLEVGSRFHRIHTRYMAMGCNTCHADVKFPENVQFLRREEFPLTAYPGAVDRATCMGCHRGEGSLARPYYKVPKK
jgi:hypothetical protein